MFEDFKIFCTNISAYFSIFSIQKYIRDLQTHFFQINNNACPIKDLKNVFSTDQTRLDTGIFQYPYKCLSIQLH